MDPHLNDEPKTRGTQGGAGGFSIVRHLPLAVLIIAYCYENRAALLHPTDALPTLIIPAAGLAAGFFIVFRFRFLEIDGFRGWGWGLVGISMMFAVWQGSVFLLKVAGIGETYVGAISLAAGILVAVLVVALVDGPRKR